MKPVNSKRYQLPKTLNPKLATLNTKPETIIAHETAAGPETLKQAKLMKHAKHNNPKTSKQPTTINPTTNTRTPQH